MQLRNFLTLAYLAGQSSALLATFDQSNINLANYMSASFPNFTIVNYQSSGTGAVQPASGAYYIQGQGSSGTNINANGTLLLTAHSKYGHLNSYYFACYSPQEFVHSAVNCNQTMQATYYNKNGTLEVFTLAEQYNPNGQQMALIDLTGFYKYYAGLGYFTATGSTASCIRYDFHAINPTANGLPVNILLDSMNYTVTT